MTHSLLVSDGGLGGVSAGGEVAEVGMGEDLSDADGKSDGGGGAAGARTGGEVTAIPGNARSVSIRLLYCLRSLGHCNVSWWVCRGL